MGRPKNCTIRPYPVTLIGRFLCNGDNFPFYGFLEPCYIKEKGILVSGLEIVTIATCWKKKCLLQRKGIVHKRWLDMAESLGCHSIKAIGRTNTLLVFSLSLGLSNCGFDPANFMVEVPDEGCKQLS